MLFLPYFRKLQTFASQKKKNRRSESEGRGDAFSIKGGTFIAG